MNTETQDLAGQVQPISAHDLPRMGELLQFPPRNRHLNYNTAQSFEGLLLRTAPKDIITISCVDYREKDRESFLLTSAGNIPHRKLMEDLNLILPGKKMLVLRSHTDCLKSKIEVPRQEGEGEDTYQVRVEERTLERLWRDARLLLSDPKVTDALRGGLQFCAARYDVHSGETIYFETQSHNLIEEVLEQVTGHAA